MLCRWSLGREDAAGAIERAVSSAIDDGYRTADLMPVEPDPSLRPVGTRDMAAAVVERVRVADVAGVAS
jgi:isocitrate/isopropylmalate dehydrogenase